MNCMQVSIGPGVRIDRSCPRRAAGGCWLGVLLLLGLLVLGRWGAQPGGVRPGGVSTLPPLSTVVLGSCEHGAEPAGGRTRRGGVLGR